MEVTRSPCKTSTIYDTPHDQHGIPPQKTDWILNHSLLVFAFPFYVPTVVLQYYVVSMKAWDV